jgi:diguanylate cyclase (GGDEF)-like protein
VTIRRTTEANDHLSDPITGLAWPSAQLDHLRLALLRAISSGAHVGVVMLDLDNFSRIRERLGWGVGDDVLHEVGDRIRRLLRDDDMVVRLSGDQFLIVCEGVTSDDDVDALVRRVVRTVGRPMWVQGHLVNLTTSVAVATGTGATSAEALVADAAAALSATRDAPVPSPA